MGRKISMAAIREIHEEHERWRITGGGEGRCANLSGEKMSGVKLYEINLSEADLSGVDLSSANMWGLKLRGTNLKGANLRGALYLTIDQLSEVKTLYKSKLDFELMEQVKAKYPHLLEKPKST